VDHTDARDNMNKKIIELLQQRRPNAGTDWHQKLPQMAKRLEEALYSDAGSFEQYNDTQTLKGRLQQLALSMGSKNSGAAKVSAGGSGGNTAPHNTAGAPERSATQPAYLSGQSQSHVGQPSQSGGPAPGMRMLGTNGSRPPGNASLYPTHGAAGSAQVATRPPLYNIPQPTSLLDRPQDRSTGQQMPRLENSSVVSASMQQPNQHITAPRQFIKPNQINPILTQNVGAANGGVGGLGHEPSSHITSGPKHDPSSREAAGGHAQPSRYPPQHGGANPHTDEHRHQVLKQQQQRLLLLRHASKCPHAGDSCPVTPHCASMKELWQHIMSCKDQECKVAHCVSSRYVLSHYSKCKEANCPVCGPVRDAIRKNYDKSRQILSLSNSGSSHHSSNGLAADDRTGNEPPIKKSRSKDSAAAAPSNSTAPAPAKQTELDPVSCAIYCFTDLQIKSHIDHLQEGLGMKSTDVRELCMPLVDEILKHHNGYIFASPVDPVAFNIPDYPTIVKRPMDLGTVRKRLDSGYYRDTTECASDVILCFDNAMLYNPATSEVYKCAKVFKNNFDRNLKLKLDARERELETKRLNPNACTLCGEAELKFEPPNIYCNGKCGQRIRRNSYYYTARNAYHWCVSCYNDLRDPIRLANEGVLYKKDLDKKRHCEEVEEFWVQCDECQRWVHQICSLFNGRRNLSEEMKYMCPHCILEQRKKHPDQVVIPERRATAADLPRSLMSEYIEKKVNECLEKCYRDEVEKFGVAPDQVEKAPTITVRQVSSVDNAQRVREGMFERYKHKNYPAEFPCRTKCLLLFQNLDGQDVILFGMYVYEYGHKCPQPNQRRVYVSYLDSAHYFRPRTYRTAVYHEILISYLEYVKERGFHTAHIWACPPMKGDDYIFNCHPQDQKTPKDDRLRLWYVKMLQKCKERGIVHEVVDFHTEYLVDPTNDATCMPYFEGDYWVGEAENIIKKSKDSDGSDELDESDSDPDEPAKVRSKRKKKAKGSTRRVKSRSVRGTSSRPERDVVMSKLSGIIEPMKEAFFVARLLPKEYADECAVRRSKEVALESGTNGAAKKEIEKQLLQEEALSSGEVDGGSSSAGVASKRSAEESGKLTANRVGVDGIAAAEENSASAEVKQDGSEDEDSKTAAATASVKIEGAAGSKAAPASPESAPVGSENAEVKVEVKTEGDAVKQNDEGGKSDSAMEEEECSDKTSEEEIKSAATAAACAGAVSDSKAAVDGKTAKEAKSKNDDTEDRDDTQESEHFESRLAFLNLCQGNNYQFDQLRRAKHTSLMTLYHLHNPDAPKFMAVCSKCQSSILSGYRYHCETCDLDICQKCYQQNGARIHPHPLRPLSVGGAAIQLTDEQRRERQRSIALHLQLLQHASTCSATDCKSKNCQKMKVSSCVPTCVLD
jgi:E1A/CREB-binding protein